MAEYAVTLSRSPAISESERRRRLSRVYRFLLSLSAKSNSDAPGAVSQAGQGASSDQYETGRRGHGTLESAVAQVGGGAG